MGLLTFSINVTLDGCVDHQEGIADDETHAFFTRLMDEGGAMLPTRIGARPEIAVFTLTRARPDVLEKIQHFAEDLIRGASGAVASRTRHIDD
jgi:hypothetical protein